MRRAALVALVAACSLTATESSRAMTIVLSTRTTKITVTDPSLSQPDQNYSDSGPADGPWTSDLQGTSPVGTTVRAYQDSLLSDSELRGTGDVKMGTTGDYAESHYRVVFLLGASGPYTFHVDNFDNYYAFWQPTGSVILDQTDPTGQIVLQNIYSVALGRDPGGQGFPDLSAQGTLSPGTYALDYLVKVTGSVNAAGPGLSGFDFAIVPEPGTGLLLAMGVVGLAAVRARRS
jgi:hypothetical protein